jgi:two-component system LytT family sensor kinase
MHSEPGARNRWLIWTIVLVVWVLLGLIYSGPYYLETRGAGMNHSASRIFSWGILTWCAWAPLTPIMVWLARRYPLEQSSWKRNIVVHVPAFVAFSLAHSAAATAINLYIKPFDNMESPLTFWPRFLSRAKGGLASDLLVYGGVLGICYAIDYYRKYRQREFQATQLEAQLAQAQLNSLRMQLHPHFLFNTLNGIVGLVRDGKNQAAVNMLVGLSDLLRHALEHSDRQEVALKEELEFIRLYLDIQKMRFSDRLQIEMDIDPSTINALVPNLILQPLTENSLRHGIARSTAAGVVQIRSRVDDGVLTINVTDNGAGLPDNWLLKSGCGIGLANTAARLAQLYNGNHRLDVRNREGGGVEVTIQMPFRTET